MPVVSWALWPLPSEFSPDSKKTSLELHFPGFSLLCDVGQLEALSRDLEGRRKTIIQGAQLQADVWAKA